MVEALVSSTIFMIAISHSLSLFGSTMDAMGKSKLRDRINTAIHRDIEKLRNEISTWSANSSIDGMTSYIPKTEACRTNSLADELLKDKRSGEVPELEEQETLFVDLSDQGNAFKIERTVQAFKRENSGLGDGNLIQVDYRTDAKSLVLINRKVVFSIPAQGWCQYDQVSSS